jgi:hypothetical protein
MLGGEVVACTTDGFVTDIENLEQQIIDNFQLKDSLLNDYKNIRQTLSGDPSALEVKTSVKGIIQWTTRGQLSLDHTETGIPIAAMTGYQKVKDHQDNVNLIQETLLNGNKILFIQNQLTGALDSKQVSMISSQRTFRTIFDSKRFVIDSENTILETRPFNEVSEALLHRSLMMQMKTSVYSDQYSAMNVAPSKNSTHDTVKYFIRMIIHLYSYNVPLHVKYSMITILQSIDSRLTKDFILKLFSLYNLDKGNLVTKLVVFRKNSNFVVDLFNELVRLSKLHSMYKDILDIFYVYFSNFSCLPKSPMMIKNELITKLKDIDPRRIVISEKDGETIIKILKE